MRSGARHNRKTVSAGLAATFIVVTLGIAYVALMKLVLDSEQPVSPKKHRLPTATSLARARGENAATGSTVYEPAHETVTPVAANTPTPAEAELEPLLWPIRTTKLSSGFGHRIDPINGGDQVHMGVDVPVPCGTHVLAVEDGEVLSANYSETAGNMVRIAHEGGWVTVYMHLARATVHEGTKVKAGALIGFSGETGSRVTGAHLHFEVWKGRVAFDPTLFQYRLPPGPAIDPSPYASCGTGKMARHVRAPLGDEET